jgi:hypothetical protein
MRDTGPDPESTGNSGPKEICHSTAKRRPFEIRPLELLSPRRIGKLYIVLGWIRAGEGTRTPNRLFTKQVLYLLSYSSESRWLIGSHIHHRTLKTTATSKARRRKAIDARHLYIRCNPAAMIQHRPVGSCRIAVARMHKSRETGTGSFETQHCQAHFVPTRMAHRGWLRTRQKRPVHVRDGSGCRSRCLASVQVPSQL